MKLLHIGDIHLGCTLDNFRRNGEIKSVFRCLVSLVQERKIEGALLAGDVFDSGDPSNESQELYYNFLVDLQQAGCRQVIVIGGNHDSPNFLDATRGLLKRMNIHVIGNVVPGEPEREVIPLGSEADPEGYVCAVPYLRQRDVRKLCPEGETAEEQRKALAEGIEAHYRQVCAIAEKMRGEKNVPIIGMGHLYASGSMFGSARTPVGNLDPVDLNNCGSVFAYMALGHIHKPQTVGGCKTRRYAGSLLPMDLREEPFQPQVVLLDTARPDHPETVPIPQNCFHEMCVIKGSVPELREKIRELSDRGTPIWVKTVYTGSELLPNWALDLRQEFRDSPVRIIMTEVRRPAPSETAKEEEQQKQDLSELTPEKVFLAHLDRTGEAADPEQRKLFLELFRQAEQKVQDPARQKEKSGRTEKQETMRFRRLFIRNVNSLYGNNLIDFDAPEFRDGIFLISGDTGAGKSSILDAVCLALYGCTPRVKTISNTRDSVMSEGTREMQAELTFTLGETEYRASFSHEKTGARAQIPFKTPMHRLFRDGQEIPPAVPRAGIRPEIRKLIGMDEKQFFRCVLLAQGSFDAFLKSDSGQRSEILKNITGTKIYTQIGMQINQEYSSLKNEHTLNTNALNGIVFLPEEKRQELRKNINETAEKLEETGKDLDVCKSREGLFQDAEQSRKELDAAALAAGSAQKAQQEAEPERQELREAERALNCLDPCRTCREKRKEIASLTENLENLRKQQKELELRSRTASEKSLQQENALGNILGEQTEKQKLFQEVRSVDSRITEQKKQAEQSAAELKNAEERKKQAEETYGNAEKKWTAAQQASASAEKYLKDHPGDEKLASRAGTWEVRRLQLVKEENANRTEQTALQTLSAAFRKKENALAELKKKQTETEKKLDLQSQTLRRETLQLEELLEGKTEDELHAASAAASRLSDFFRDSSRRKEYLTPGQPCPLCGSVTHPYCEGTPVPDSGEFSRTAELLNRRLAEVSQCRDRIRQAEQEKNRLEVLLTGEKARVEAQVQQLQSEEQTIGTKRTAWEEACRKTAESAASLTDEFRQTLQTEWQDHSALPGELEQRIREYTCARRTADALEEDRQRHEAAVIAHDAVSGQINELIREKSASALHAAEILKESIRKRQELFGEKDAAEEEEQWNSRVEQYRRDRDLSATEKVRAQEALLHNRTDQETLNRNLEALRPEKEAAEKTLAESLRQYGFASEEEFLAKQREPQKIQTLREKLKELDDRVRTATTTLAERKRVLEEKTAQIPEGVDRAGNLEQIRTLQQKKQELEELRQEAGHQWKNDEEARKNHAAAKKAMEELEKKLNQWKFLDDRFGSTSNSDKFGKIAQGYTFRELLRYANANRLQQLKDHFTLVSGKEDPLELDVIDHCRGDQVRTSRNLSGGESFEVSLALALGLSEMSAVSQNARLGNVLLDEGFGTLDEKSLDGALELLMQLERSDRKLVGIISHVPKLKEMIGARIEVTGSGGIGTLSGAGVASGTVLQSFPVQKAEEAKAKAAPRRRKRS